MCGGRVGESRASGTGWEKVKANASLSANRRERDFI